MKLPGRLSRYDSGSPKSDWTSEAAGTKAVIVRRQVGGDAPHLRRR